MLILDKISNIVLLNIGLCLVSKALLILMVCFVEKTLLLVLMTKRFNLFVAQ